MRRLDLDRVRPCRSGHREGLGRSTPDSCRASTPSRTHTSRHRTKALRASLLQAGNVGWQVAGERREHASAVTDGKCPVLRIKGLATSTSRTRTPPMSQTPAAAQPISPLRRRMIEDMTVRGFAEKTQSDYIRHVKNFTIFLGRSPDTAEGEDLRTFQLHQRENRVQPPTMNGAVAALRFFFTTTCDRPEMARHLRLVRQPQKLPVVLTTDEVLRLLEAAPGPKYKAALGVAYGAGLRVSEVANLKVSDIDSERMVLRVEQSLPRRRPGAKARRTATACCRRGSWSCCGSGGAWASRRPGCSRGATRCWRSRHASCIGWFAIRRMRWGSRSVCRRTRSGTRSPRIFWSRVSTFA